MKQETGSGKHINSDDYPIDMDISSTDMAENNLILRRNNRGCKYEDFYSWPEESLEDMDSPFCYQQYIQQLIHRNPADIDEILRLPENQEVGVWKVEHLRMICMQLNRLAVRLQDCCFPGICNQMTATEQWIFLCAAHKQPNECPAIDYTRHTLDGAASLLNSTKYFPSRVTVKENSVQKLGSVCRRLYRIFSHAYYHHFQVYEEFEDEFHLCKRFSKFVTMYELMPREHLIVPTDGSRPLSPLEPTPSASAASVGASAGAEAAATTAKTTTDSADGADESTADADAEPVADLTSTEDDSSNWFTKTELANYSPQKEKNGSSTEAESSSVQKEDGISNKQEQQTNESAASRDISNPSTETTAEAVNSNVTTSGSSTSETSKTTKNTTPAANYSSATMRISKEPNNNANVKTGKDSKDPDSGGAKQVDASSSSSSSPGQAHSTSTRA